jgi:small GTP-binding protein
MLKTSKGYDHIYKIVIVGDSNVGKSHVLSRFVKNRYKENYVPTIGVEFYIKTVNLHGKNIKLQMWDTAGQERYRSIVSAYYRGVSGVVFVFDITDHTSFKNINSWYDDVKIIVPDEVPLLLIGNKSDLGKERCVDTDDAIEFAKNHNMTYFETSVITNNNIYESFDYLISKMYDYNINIGMEENPKLVKIDNDDSDDENDSKRSCVC